jgi:hypothetical protein
MCAAIAITVGCDSAFDPADALAGDWLSPTTLSGTYTTITLAGSGRNVTGTGTRFIEAGAPAAFDILGTRTGIGVSLTWFFESGELLSYEGYMEAADRIRGNVITTTHDTVRADFFRQ